MTSTLPPLVQAFSGALGSAAANALTYPLDLLTTRLQLESPERSRRRGELYGATLIFRQIADRYGWHAFYDGITADTYATLLSNFFYFYFYSFLRLLSTKRLLPFISRSKHSGVHKPSMIEELFLGYIAGIASRLVATPLNIVTLRLQTDREDNDADGIKTRPRNTGMIAIVKRIYKEQGLAGFWRGFQMSAVLALNPSITLAFFQMFGRFLALAKSSRFGSIRANKLSLKQAPVNANLSPWEAFFGAAIANSIAVSILYPLILAKKRLQMSSSASIKQILTDAYSGNVRSTVSDTQDVEKGHGQQNKGVRGIQGLYQGYQMKIITGFLSQGVTFLIKGRIEQMIIALYLARIKRIR